MVASKSRPGPINLHSFISALIGITYGTFGEEKIYRIRVVLVDSSKYQMDFKGQASGNHAFFPEYQVFPIDYHI